MKLPYYGERRPAGDKRFLSVDAERSLGSMRQGVLDVRRAATWLADRPEVDPEKLGVTGISLGGIVSSLAAAIDPRINRGAFMLAGGNLGEILWTMPRDRPISRGLDRDGADQGGLAGVDPPGRPDSPMPIGCGGSA